MLQSECVLLFLRRAGYEPESVIMLLSTSEMTCCMCDQIEAHC